MERGGAHARPCPGCTRPCGDAGGAGRRPDRDAHAAERHEDRGLARQGHPERRDVHVVPRRQPQRATGHHGHLALLRAHDVQRHEDTAARRIRPRDGSAAAAATTPTPAPTSPCTRTGFPVRSPDSSSTSSRTACATSTSTPKKVESERGVVYSERRSSVDNDNFGTLIEQMQATAFVAHPYQIPTIGWPSDIEGWKITDLQDYYRQYYAPNNAVIFVVGDVDPDGGLQAGRPVPGQHSGAARAARRHHEGAAAARRAPPAHRARSADAVARDGVAYGRSVRARGAGDGSAAGDPR